MQCPSVPGSGCPWEDQAIPTRMSTGWGPGGMHQPHLRNAFSLLSSPPMSGLLFEESSCIASYLHFKEKNASEVVCSVLHHQVVPVEICGVWNWMVFPTVVLIKLLIQDGCQLRQSVKKILLDNDYYSTKMHLGGSSYGAGTVGILTEFLWSNITHYTALKMNSGVKLRTSIVALISYILHL